MTKKLNISPLLLLIVFILTITGSAFAQNSKEDLVKKLGMETDEQKKALILYQIAELEFDKSVDDAIAYSEKSLQSAINADDQGLRAQNLFLLAKAYNQKEKSNMALKYYLKSAAVFEKIDDIEILPDIYYNSAELYTKLEAYDKAVNYYYHAYNLYESQSYFKKMIQSLEKVAFSYEKTENYTKALEYHRQLLKYYQDKEDSENVIKVLSRIVNVYYQIEDYEAALEYNFEIYQLHNQNGNILGTANASNNLGFNYVFINDYEKAIGAFKQSLLIDSQLETSEDSRTATLINLGICYQNTGDNENAIETFLQALEIQQGQLDAKEVAIIQNLIALTYFYNDDLYNAEMASKASIEAAKEANEPEILRDSYKTYSQILQEANDYEKAMLVYTDYLNIRDSLLVEQRIKEQELSQKQYEAEKSEKELRLMLADEEMTDLALKQLKLEAEKKEKEMALLLRDKELQKSTLNQQKQAMALEKKRHEAQLQQQEIQNLQREKELQDAKLKQEKLKKKEQEKAIQLLEREKEVKDLEIARQDEQRKRAQYMGALFFIIFLLILYGLIQTRKKNRELDKQKKEIQTKNADLEQKNEEILVQKKNLEQANEEILAKNEELNQQKEEILSQRDHIETQRDEIMAKHTQLKRHEMVLASQLTAIDSSVGAMEFDLHGKIIKVNDRYLEIAGISKDEVIGKYHHDFMSKEKKHEDGYQDFWKKMKKGDHVTGGHQYFFNGKEKWFYESFTSVRDEVGKPYKTLALVVDVTKTREQADQLRKQAQTLQDANAAIEKKNKSITDSIHYAKRIQTALLPPDEAFTQHLAEHFILFKPRDIVSGDFYWMKQIGNLSLIAAADCTGHGVPGAFMSMLGVSFLNEITGRGITNAGEILTQLRDMVKTSLRQTGKEGEAKDGMDMALCVINNDTHELQYAGAYNPLYLIRNNELTHYKADKMPIGIYIREKSNFTNHSIQLEKDDRLYIFSDGFVDQIGGTRPDKFKPKRFRELLMENYKKPMLEQQQILDASIEKWRKVPELPDQTYSQIDDILVIGIRI